MAHKKSENTTQKKESNFYSFRKKSREWHTKNPKIQDLAEISFKHTKKHTKVMVHSIVLSEKSFRKIKQKQN